MQEQSWLKTHLHNGQHGDISQESGGASRMDYTKTSHTAGEICIECFFSLFDKHCSSCSICSNPEDVCAMRFHIYFLFMHCEDGCLLGFHSLPLAILLVVFCLYSKKFISIWVHHLALLQKFWSQISGGLAESHGGRKLVTTCLWSQPWWAQMWCRRMNEMELFLQRNMSK